MRGIEIRKHVHLGQSNSELVYIQQPEQIHSAPLPFLFFSFLSLLSQHIRVSFFVLFNSWVCRRASDESCWSVCQLQQLGSASTAANSWSLWNSGGRGQRLDPRQKNVRRSRRSSCRTSTSPPYWKGADLTVRPRRELGPHRSNQKYCIIVYCFSSRDGLCLLLEKNACIFAYLRWRNCNLYALLIFWFSQNIYFGL